MSWKVSDPLSDERSLKKVRKWFNLDEIRESVKDELGLIFDIVKVVHRDNDEDSIEITLRLKQPKGKDGKFVSDEAKAFKMYAESYGLKPTDLGKWITVMGSKHEIIGLRPNAHKNNIIIRSGRGARYVMPSGRVKDLLKEARKGE